MVFLNSSSFTFITSTLIKAVSGIRLCFFATLLLSAAMLHSSAAHAQENTSNEILTMGDSLTAGLFGNAFGFIRCAALGNIPIAADNQRSCRGDGRINVGGWQPILKSITGLNSFNFGNTNDNTAEMVNRFQSALAQRPSKYVLILGGTNDVIQNRSRAETIANIERMIRETRAANRIPIVGTIPPLLFGRFAFANSRVEELNDLIRAIPDVEIADHHAILVTNWAAYHSGDTIHLGPGGNQIVAQGWADAIARVNEPQVILAPIIDLLLSD